MKKILACATALLLLGLSRPADAGNEFFVFDNGLHGRGLETVDAKLDLVKSVGFDGLSWRTDDPATIRTLLTGAKRRGLKVPVIYVSLDVREDRLAYDPRIPEIISLCKGSDTIIWPLLVSKRYAPSSPEGDPVAVKGLREFADLAAASGLRVAIYPHFAQWVQSVDDALRLIRQVNRPNLGVTFNLCHALLGNDDARIPAQIEAAAPYLMVATINGANGNIAPGTFNDRVKDAILPLDRGSFDVPALLRKLRSVGFKGPIGLQCYHVEGDPREILPRSFAAWEKMRGSARLSAAPSRTSSSR